VTGYAETLNIAYISIATFSETITQKIEYKELNREKAIEFVSIKALEYLEKLLLSL
jgi:hypothetical protein